MLPSRKSQSRVNGHLESWANNSNLESIHSGLDLSKTLDLSPHYMDFRLLEARCNTRDDMPAWADYTMRSHTNSFFPAIEALAMSHTVYAIHA